PLPHRAALTRQPHSAPIPTFPRRRGKEPAGCTRCGSSPSPARGGGGRDGGQPAAGRDGKRFRAGAWAPPRPPPPAGGGGRRSLPPAQPSPAGGGGGTPPPSPLTLDSGPDCRL